MLADVCELAGFQDMTHFIRVVKKLTGLTPGDLKRRLVDEAALTCNPPPTPPLRERGA